VEGNVRRVPQGTRPEHRNQVRSLRPAPRVRRLRRRQATAGRNPVVRAHGIRTAIVSASANTVQVLQSAGIEDLFDTRIDGVIAKERGLRGKPAPDTFLAAAEALGVPAAHAVVFEDAQAGVAAGHAGHFALVVGVDRVGQAAELKAHGADIVVKDLSDLLKGNK
jgi:HAD superfamily hydrolase (TIGR01509 family)